MRLSYIASAFFGCWGRVRGRCSGGSWVRRAGTALGRRQLAAQNYGLPRRRPMAGRAFQAEFTDSDGVADFERGQRRATVSDAELEGSGGFCGGNRTALHIFVSLGAHTGLRGREARV